MSESTGAKKKNNIKRLSLSAKDKKLVGVCGGIAEYFGIDSTLVRLAWILITILTAIVPGVIGYFVAALIMPPAPSGDAK